MTFSSIFLEEDRRRKKGRWESDAAYLLIKKTNIVDG